MKEGKEPEAKDAQYYKGLGFLCGLEIHQRLATKRKLFCECPADANVSDDNVIAQVSRYQRAVAGELGSIDVSTSFEGQKRRKFLYNVYRKHSCLVELDEEPPHDLNMEALETTLAIASAMGMRVIDEMQPMRKEVVDGSDTSAFQRTILAAMDGSITVQKSRIRVTSLSLEEESAGIVEAKGDSVVYDLSRLGIPLVEIDTDPYIPTPAMVKGVALYIGTMLRVSGRVQRGIGSIRQDVNISIKEGARVEIKGLQDIDSIDKYIENEVARQQALVQAREELKKAKASVGEVQDVTGIFAGTQVKVLSRHFAPGQDGAVFAFRLEGFKGLLGREVNPGRRLGTEISDYAKMGGVNGIIHSDEDLGKYGFAEKELEQLRKGLKLGKDDSFILVAGQRTQAGVAAGLANGRAWNAIRIGVLPETRGVGDTKAFTTRFLRPLPGGDRMYPETDAKPVLVTPAMLKKAEAEAPDVEKEMKALAGALRNESLASQLLTSPRLRLYKDIVSGTKADPAFVANVLVQKFTELKRGGVDVDSIGDGALYRIFDAYAKGEITKQAVDELLKGSPKDERQVDKDTGAKGLKRIAGKALIELVERERKANPGATKEALRNVIMSRHRLNVDGSELNDALA